MKSFLNRTLNRPIWLILVVTLISQLSVCTTSAKDRDQNWIADIEFLSKQLKSRHANAFHTLTEPEFDKGIEELKADVAKLDDEQLEMRIHLFVASIGDAHTVVNNDFKKFDFFSFNLKAFDDGLLVVATEKANEKALGGKVVKIGKYSLQEFWENYGRVVAHDNQPGLEKAYSTNSNIAQFLNAAGAIDSKDQIALTVEKGGDTFEVTYRARPFDKIAPREWAAVRPKQLALYASKPHLKFWNDWLPQQKAIYFKYNLCQDAKGFSNLVKGTQGFIAENDVEKFIVDLRDNPGGNSTIFAPLLEYLKSQKDLNQKGRLFVIIGRGTFSSGIFNALEMKSATNAILVGQPTSGRPNHYGEVKTFQLPHSKLTVQYSTKYHKMIGDSDPDSVEPDIKVPFTFDDVINGNDPSLEAVLNYKND